MLYKTLLRPLFFGAEPERAHDLALSAAAALGRSPIALDSLETLFVVEDRRLRQTVLGIEFPNPVGLAAGYDKNAVGVNIWPAIGFGFVEIGSVTARPQPGNEPPRLFRLTGARALINRMGMNNVGAEIIATRVPRRPHRVPVGVNVGLNRDVDLADAAGNYAETIAQFRDRADFFVINISSPNTPGLRRLQDKLWLDDFLAGVGRLCESALRHAASQKRPTAGLLLKIAPDLTFEQMDDVVAIALKHNLAGVVATNTTVDHPSPPEGGLSGAPLRARATECVRHLWRQTQGKLPIIGVGGIFTAADAYEKIRAGASLVEVWTAMVYEGPAIARNINRGLLRLLERDGFKNVSEAIGETT
jgi:dihydroorotate dehydrogenase